MLQTYPYRQICPGIWEINEYDCASMYLAVGTERAALIDAGIGLGDLGAFVRTLTDLPVKLLLTHNHRDHVGNAPLFPELWMSEPDQRMGAIIRPLTERSSRLQYAMHTRSMHPDREYPWAEEDMFDFPQEREPRVNRLNDGDRIELGGRTITCVWTPGHTPGSMSFLDSESGALFCGDACNEVLGLGVRPIPGMRHATVEEAYRALKRLDAMDFDHAAIYNGHGDFRTLGKALRPSVLPAVMRTMEQILSGDFHATPKLIKSIKAQVEIVSSFGVELQFHRENIFGIGEYGTL